MKSIAVASGVQEARGVLIPEVTIGLDLGNRRSYFCMLDQTGTVVEEGKVATTRKALEHKFCGGPSVRIALENGTPSRWVSQLLEAAGHEVIVANPRQVRLIGENTSKDDRVDAERLARLARVDPKLLAPIQHRSDDTQADLLVLRSRDLLVGTRTKLINHVRGVLRSRGIQVPKCSTRSFEARAAEHVPDELQPALAPVLEELHSLNAKIIDYDRKIKEMAVERYPQSQLLTQVNGVGALTALFFLLTIEDPRRFKKSRTVGAFLGLRPKRRQSGGQDPELRITKAGDRDVRRVLVQAAQYILGPFGKDSDLRRWGLRLADRGGKAAKKRAIIAVARKLSVLLHRLWVTAEVYEPLRNSEPAKHKA